MTARTQLLSVVIWFELKGTKAAVYTKSDNASQQLASFLTEIRFTFAKLDLSSLGVSSSLMTSLLDPWQQLDRASASFRDAGESSDKPDDGDELHDESR